MTTSISRPSLSGTAFQHEAFFYTDRASFLTGILPFLHDGLTAGEPTLVVLDTEKIEFLRAELGDDADQVLFADMAQVGRNPARIIPYWQSFVARRNGGNQPIRGIGEPIWSDRTPDELIECQAHETLLNLAFADTPAFHLLCPYDLVSLPTDVIDEARLSHPVLSHGSDRQDSVDYLATHPSPARRDHPLPPAPDNAVSMPFGQGTALSLVRDLVTRHATRWHLDGTAVDGLVMAANELATNSLRHGAGQGTIRMWRDETAVICEISDTGQLIGDPLLGRRKPSLAQPGGRGLWLVNQLCDLVQIRHTSTGTTVRVHMRIPTTHKPEDKPT
jgi:anti-sigma regulatory factor (Ser/Thr protein kinase)